MLMNNIINEFEKNFPKEVKKNFNRQHKIGAKIFDKNETKLEENLEKDSKDKTIIKDKELNSTDNKIEIKPKNIDLASLIKNQ